MNILFVCTSFGLMYDSESIVQSSSSFPSGHCLIPSQRCESGTQLSRRGLYES